MTGESAAAEPGPPPPGLGVETRLDGWFLPGRSPGRQRRLRFLVAGVVLGVVGIGWVATVTSRWAMGTLGIPTLILLLVAALVMGAVILAVAARAGRRGARPGIHLRPFNLTLRPERGEARVIAWQRIGPAETTHRVEADAIGMELDKGRTVRLRWATDGRPFAATHAGTDWEVLTLGQGLGPDEARWLEDVVAWLREHDQEHRVHADVDDLIAGSHERRAREAIQEMRARTEEADTD